MGTQQLLFVILGVVVVGVAIAIGLSLFSAQSTSSNRDAMINDISHLAAVAYQYRVSLRVQGGGQGSYVGFLVPPGLQRNSNGDYSITDAQTQSITLVGASLATPTNTIQVTVDSNGRLVNWTFTGDFK
jgi:hypothetical protein